MSSIGSISGILLGKYLIFQEGESMASQLAGMDAVEKKYTETAGAIIVMSIVGGAFVPAIQGYVSDVTGSMQLSFIINVLCFAFIGWYFHKEHKLETEEEELVVANHSA